MQYAIVITPEFGVMRWEVQSDGVVLMSGSGADYLEAFHNALNWMGGA